jgi:flagellar biogenesis protein FliO
MEFLQQSAALLAVFGLLGTAFWFVKMRRQPGLGPGRDRRMQVIERVALSPQHTLCLVKVGERIVMIGTAPSSCQLIDIDRPEVRS